MMLVLGCSRRVPPITGLDWAAVAIYSVKNIITQTTTADLIWKIGCARAGSNCSTSGSTWLALQSDPVAAAQHEAMRTMLEGAGKVGGVGVRAIDTVTRLYETEFQC